MNSPEFSIIIPTRNRRCFLEKAIHSIVAQQGVSCEIIIIDDASTDDTQQYVDGLKESNICLKYIRNTNSIFAHNARREGYMAASGAYVVFMDDDDFYLNDAFFSESREIFSRHPDVHCVLGGTIEYEDGNLNSPKDLKANGLVDQKTYINGFEQNYPKPHSTLTAIFRKRSLDLLNLADARMVNDTCIYLYGLLSGDVFIINSSVAAYRIHSSNISKNKFTSDFIIDCLFEKKKIYEKALERNLLLEPRAWYYHQIKQSVYYFLKASSLNIQTLIHISAWLILHGEPIRLRFLSGLICRLLGKK